MLEIIYDDNGVAHIGKRKYSGDISVDTIMSGKRYNRKELIYPGGYRQLIYCNNPRFGISASDVKTVVQQEKDEEAETVHKEKSGSGVIREDSILRCERSVEAMLLCELEFTHFITVTFNDEKIDGTNVGDIIKKLRYLLNNQQKRKGLKYLLVPEYHPEKNEHRIHLHGCVNDVFNLVDSETRTLVGRKRPMLLSKIKRLGLEDRIKSVVYNIPEWKYGWSTAIPIYGTRLSMARYVSKYIGKATRENGKIFGKMFWSSKNVERYPVTKLVDDCGMSFASVPAKEYNPGFGDIYKYQKRYGDINDIGESDEEIELAYMSVFAEDNPEYVDGLTAREMVNALIDNNILSRVRDARKQQEHYDEIYRKAEEARKQAEADREARKNTEAIKRAVRDIENKRQIKMKV